MTRRRRIFNFLLASAFGVTAAGALPTYSQKTVPVQAGEPYTVPDVASFSRLSREELEMLVADVAVQNPQAVKYLADDPEARKSQIENLRQLLAFASQALKEGLANHPVNRQELENIRSEVIAANYDREINKDKPPMPPFGFITEEQVTKYWDQGGFQREADFKSFVDAKLALLKESDPKMKDREISAEEVAQAREFFAKIKIYEQEYEGKLAAGQIPMQLRKKIDLQVRVQQAQFLARLYSEKLAEKVRATDEQVAEYIAAHPELSTEPKRAKAEEILRRAKAGEDFAALANEFSEDPGNKILDGKPLGGLYAGVKKGQFVPAFEAAALALAPGQVAPSVVETDFGYHVIKLEKKGSDKAEDGQSVETYDVRHVLLSTVYKDPADPNGREVPVKSYVRSKLEAEKEAEMIKQMVAANNVDVPADFTVPKVPARPTTKPAAKRPPVKKRPIKKRRS